MPMKRLLPFLVLLALALSSCASAGRLVVDPGQARRVAVLTAPSRVGVISRGNMEVLDDSLGNAATEFLAQALSISYLIDADTVVQAERFSALEDSVHQVVNVAQAVRKRKLSQVRVPDNIVEFARSQGERYLLLATHGGLECAIMGAKYPNWEMVSIGPTIVHPHSPDERVKIDTVAQTWEFLKAVLENIPEK